MTHPIGINAVTGEIVFAEEPTGHEYAQGKWEKFCHLADIGVDNDRIHAAFIEIVAEVEADLY